MKINLLRIAWLVIALLYLLLYILSIPAMTEGIRQDAISLFSADLPRLGLDANSYVFFFISLNTLYLLTATIVGFLIFWRRSQDTNALILSLALIAFQIEFGRSAIALAASIPSLIPLLSFARAFAASLVLWILFTFPDGRIKPEWTGRILLFLVLLTPLANDIRWYMQNGQTTPFVLITILSIGIGLALQVYRYRRIYSPIQRQQSKWVLYGIAIAMTGLVFFVIIDLAVTPFLLQHSFLRLIYRLVVNSLLIYLPLMAIPICVFIAVSRNRLWDIDLLVNRSLVMLGMSLSLASVYIATVLLLTAILQGTGLEFSLLIALLIAGFMFNPMRKTMQNLIDRRFYHWRFDLNEIAAARIKTPAPSGNLTGQMLGSYKLEDVLGKGGMGEVYRAKQGNQFLAVKTILPAVRHDAALIERFRRESLTLQRLQHPNIVHCHAAGEDKEIMYMVLDYIEGIELKKLIRQREKLSPEDCRDVLAGIASALDYAHAQGVIHRDLKPANILLRLAKDGGTIQPMLMDFGIAKLSDASRVITGTGALGTIDYMAPEQINSSRTVDYRADIYALGVVFFEMLTGKLPFSGSIGQIVFAHLQKPPPDPREFVPEIPPAYADATMRALAKDADDRWQSAKAMLEALA